MFLFAHVGITLGAAALISGIVAKWRAPAGIDNPKATGHKLNLNKKESLFEKTGFKALAGYVDIRLLLLGSMLPDIVDKPLSFFGFGNGRSIMHTLLILCVILLIGLFQYINFKKTWFLALTFGTAAHLILDFMWLMPSTLLWPWLGWSFPEPAFRIGLQQFYIWWHVLTTYPSVIVPEIIGLIILIGFSVIAARQRKLRIFLAEGKV